MTEENTTETEVVETETVETPSIEDELGDIFDKANAEESDDGPARGPDGKFVSRETDETATAEPEGEAEGAEEISSDPAPEPPATWSDDVKAHWQGLSPELRKHILEQEEVRQKAIEDSTRLKGYEPIAQALEPVRQNLALNGVDDVTYVRQLVAADQYLRNNPQEAIQWLARQYGASLQPQSEEEIDPTIAPILNEVNQLKSQLTGFMSAQQQAEANRVQSELQAFANDHPHFENVRTQMGALMQAGTAKTLEEAYDMAVWANAETRAQMMAEKSTEAEKKRKEEAAAKAEKAKKIAAGNLSSKGTGGGQTPKQYASREEELGEIFDQVTGAA